MRTFSAHRAFVLRDRAIPVCAVVRKILGVLSCCFCISLPFWECWPANGERETKTKWQICEKIRAVEAQALARQKQTSKLAPDNKWNKESSPGGTKFTWREGRRIVELGVFAEQICFSEDIWKATIWKDHASVNLSVKFSSTSLPLPRYCKLRIW